MKIKLSFFVCDKAARGDCLICRQEDFFMPNTRLREVYHPGTGDSKWPQPSPVSCKAHHLTESIPEHKLTDQSLLRESGKERVQLRTCNSLRPNPTNQASDSFPPDEWGAGTGPAVSHLATPPQVDGSIEQGASAYNCHSIPKGFTLLATILHC